MAIEKLFHLMVDKRASDMYLSVGSPIMVKINGNAIAVNGNKLDLKSVQALLDDVLSAQQWEEYRQNKELNIAHRVPGLGSFRISAFCQRGSVSAVVRYVPGDVPSFESLRLPRVMSDLIMESRGLLLVVGGTGSGKTTSLAGMIDFRNTHRAGHILTIEDPIEYNFRNKKSIVNQREIGTDCASLDIALKNALRQAPDCIMIGEIRDSRSMTAAMSFAQSGHLCVGTLHANNAAHALNRVYSLFPAEAREVLKGDLGTSLRAIIGQRLVKTRQGSRRPINEILLNVGHVGELITKGAVSDIKEQMSKSLAPGSVTFEQVLVDLVNRDIIDQKEALASADSPTNLMWMLNHGGQGPERSAPAQGSMPVSPLARTTDSIPVTATSIVESEDQSQLLFSGIGLMDQE